MPPYWIARASGRPFEERKKEQVADCYNCIQSVNAALGYVLEDFRRAVSVLRLLPVSITQRSDLSRLPYFEEWKSHNSKEKCVLLYNLLDYQILLECEPLYNWIEVTKHLPLSSVLIYILNWLQPYGSVYTYQSIQIIRLNPCNTILSIILQNLEPYFPICLTTIV